MKKHSTITLYDPKEEQDVDFEIHSEKPKGKTAPFWYVKDPRTGIILNREDPFESQPTLQDVFKVTKL